MHIISLGTFQATETLPYSDVIMSAMASQITIVSIGCSTVCSGADQRKQQSSVLLAFVLGVHQWPVDAPHKGPVTRKMSPFDDVTMYRRIVDLHQTTIPNDVCTVFTILRIYHNSKTKIDVFKISHNAPIHAREGGQSYSNVYSSQIDMSQPKASLDSQVMGDKA